MTQNELNALAEALDLLHDFISNGGAGEVHYEILNRADSVFYKLKEEIQKEQA